MNSATSGYHETLTVFWIRIVTAFCAERKGESRVAVINELVKLPRDLFRAHYSYDVVTSPKRARAWVAPDLLSLLRITTAITAIPIRSRT